MVDDMVASIKPLAEHINLSNLKGELPAYLSAAKDIVCAHDDVHTFTNQVLTFWRYDAKKAQLKEWCKAASIIFAMPPNSAACERVFSLLKNMYGDQQMNTLADHIQASLMMKYNGRSVCD